MAIELVKAFFKEFNREQDILEFEVSSATVELAAEALGVEGKRIAKSLSFHGNEGYILVIAAGDARIDNKTFKERFEKKAKMLSPEEVLTATNHDIGGVCPFGIPKDTKVYFDTSLKRFETVFPACGSSNSAIELTLDELEKYVDHEGWVTVTKGWQEGEIL